MARETGKRRRFGGTRLAQFDFRLSVCAGPTKRRGTDGVEETSSVECLHGRNGEAPHPQPSRFERRVEILHALQYKNGDTSQPKFAREKETYRPSAGNHHVINHS